MARKVRAAETPKRVALEGGMTIYTALELKERLLAPLRACSELEVDLSGVEEIDSAGLQLMVLAKREAGTQGKRLRFSGHSQAVVEALDLCGLSAWFGDPVVIRSRNVASQGE